MDRLRTWCLAAAAAAGLWLAAAPAYAQGERPARPYRGLFGSDNRSADSRDQLDLSFGFNGAADNGYTTPAAPGETTPSYDTQFEEFYSAGVNLVYTRRGRTVQAGATASASYPYYPLYPDSSALAYSGSGNVGHTTGSTSVAASGRYSYSPFYTFGLGSGSPFSGMFDYASSFSPNRSASGGLSASRRLNRRTSIAASYSVGGSDFVLEDRWSANQGARVSFSRETSRNTALELGYGYSRTNANETVSGSLEQFVTQSHDGDVGFSASRRTPRGGATGIHLGFGASLLDAYGTEQVHPRYRGSASVDQSIPGGWVLGAGYTRSLQYVGGLLEPVWSDNANVRASGPVNRRVSLTLDATYSSGAYITAGESGYTMYSASASARYAITQYAALSAQYIYYSYDFPSGFELPPGMPPRLSRHRLQAGAVVWVPLARIGRAPAPPPAAQ